MNNQQVHLTFKNDLKEDEIILAQFEQTKFESLPRPIKLIKDVLTPEAPNKKDEQKRQYYKKAIADAPFILSAGEQPLFAPKLDPITNQMISTKPIITLGSRKIKEEEKFALIQVQDDGNATINILDENWIFSRKADMEKPLFSNAVEEVDGSDDTRVKKKEYQSEEERYSNFSDNYGDDEDDFNEKNDKTASDDSEDEEKKEAKSRKRLSSSSQPAPRKELMNLIIEKMKASGDEMFLDDLNKSLNPDGNEELSKKLTDLYARVLTVSKQTTESPLIVTLKKEHSSKKPKKRTEKKSEKKPESSK
ncbi:hypothetical protein ENUP19_0284G0019 [Entamoeba nuttalli]|uniref:Uncharacterized protein n=2 Tax=Entamoeba nuttalli TaxID=412467 RepID=K2G7A0_ENTNP|nr:hypothetical protein ENU1_171570 [Entamoeba nuttalli P19]EKE38281.1 hypothetical protein ENU1_171570 [Entamoeba nuttalli P19]|eukprot:XP_008859383.1 hypothetical protein ENU1_171570 [Entamoeba nuttalli P19]